MSGKVISARAAIDLITSGDTLAIHGAGGQVEFRVRDHGPGIPADQRTHIGEPFYRSDISRTRETGGTGLGLYLARQVARAHGGELSLVDIPERGALFSVIVPGNRPESA